ncbi:methionyl-tRNA formyltransferase [Sphingobacterium sp. UT-1RO-CII-1]|uniref:methionyl-tRNA formyltransferase n=1 Tax=Sphingobacterium sp. UT-1RO-CII-1 TaxID=2995225 RepID=UPI00227BDAC3|nr:methionyl-tRNA formyltransferase [Sphingobacterium sp. UT-1RO-CII-1]MCY4778841.1 methionyl-tRNA formyltransferase [Sphingobacterium sp. UT-1RO-CII-1]
MRIIFMGTPDFAVASLQALLQAGENVVAVVTSTDKPAGRGQKLQESAVKKFAVAHNIPVLQPVKLKDSTFLEELASYQADLQVVVAFRMLPEVVWNMPPKGTINVHASLLPQYRGAAPINHAIMNGETKTGVTTFMLQHEIDTGVVLFATETPITSTDNAGTLHDKLMQSGAETLIKTVHAIKSGNIQPIEQNTLINEPLKSAPKIFKEDCLIDWNDSTENVYNKIRGLSPYPAAYTILEGKTLKIYDIEKDSNVTATAGSFETDGKTQLSFSTADGRILIKELQIEGKKRMSTVDFLRGYRFDI